jgi:hypothetical protein
MAVIGPLRVCSSQDEPAIRDPTPAPKNFREKLHDCGLGCCRNP